MIQELRVLISPRAGWLAALFLFFSAAHVAQAAVPNVVLFDDFEGGVPNALDGYLGAFQSGASKIDALRDTTFFHGPGKRGTSLRIRANKQEEGFCGVWLQCFDSKVAKKKFFNAKPFGYLSFWVRGQTGGETFTIKLADGSWIAKEDSFPLGEVRKYLPNGVNRNWQEVLIPLSDAASLDLEQFAGITFLFSTVGQSVVFVDDLCFKTTAEVNLHPNGLETSTPAIARNAAPRTMWLWNLDELLEKEAARESLFDLCAHEGIEQLWVQVSYKIDPLSVQVASTGGKTIAASVKLRREDQLRQFLAAAHQMRLQVHALDGDPEFSVRAMHSVPLGVVEAVIAFNQQSSPDQRFDGIHFDNEPHALLGWHDRSRREKMLKDFLDLSAECQRRVRTQSGLTFGVDIPFWWHHVDLQTGKPIGDVVFNGKKKAASWHCLDLFDNVGLMNYRDNADGADGMVVHGQELLAYADNNKGARVFMGVETVVPTPADAWYVVGLPRKRFEATLRGPGREFADLCRYDGFRLRRIDDGQNVHVGLEVPIAPDADEVDRFGRGLKAVAEKFGASSGNLSGNAVVQARAAAETAVRVDPELRNFRNRNIANADGTEIAGFQVTSIMLPKITFGDNTYDDFQSQVTAAENSFRDYKKFGGMAVHSFESFQMLARPQRVTTRR
ncbi:MAG: hypothetical protein NT013_15850 [Planctomycetia bacterium]|nr:hypothetical protein [Planctomycetia bacterium]